MSRQEEMAAIAYTVINRASYLRNHHVPLSFFGAKSATIRGVITPSQFGSLGTTNFALAAHPEQIDTPALVGRLNCDFLKLAIETSAAALKGAITDPFSAEGGVYGFRTSGHGGPGGTAFYAFPAALQVAGSGNTFFGLNKP